VSSLFCAEVAFAKVEFTPADIFSIPEKNSVINFADSGFCDNADFQENTWYFTNLTFNEDAANYISVLAISASNCHLTVTHYDPPANVPDTDNPFRPSWLNYTVVGKGSQDFNFNLRDYPIGYRWKVIIDGAEKPRDKGWSLSEDGWLTVTEPISAVSIYFYFTVPNEGPASTDVFLLVVIVSLLAVVVTYLLFLVLYRKRRHKKIALICLNTSLNVTLMRVCKNINLIMHLSFLEDQSKRRGTE